jgi:hypothetical protein
MMCASGSLALGSSKLDDLCLTIAKTIERMLSTSPFSFSWRIIIACHSGPEVASAATTGITDEVKVAVTTAAMRWKRLERKRVKTLASHMLASEAIVLTDGLRCFRGVVDAGSMRLPVRTGSGRRAARNPVFKWGQYRARQHQKLTGAPRLHKASTFGIG